MSTDNWLIDWCLTPTFALFKLYRDVNKLYIIIYTTTLRNKTYSCITQSGYMYMYK